MSLASDASFEFSSWRWTKIYVQTVYLVLLSTVTYPVYVGLGKGELQLN